MFQHKPVISIPHFALERFALSDLGNFLKSAFSGNYVD